MQKGKDGRTDDRRRTTDDGRQMTDAQWSGELKSMSVSKH